MFSKRPIHRVIALTTLLFMFMSLVTLACNLPISSVNPSSPVVWVTDDPNAPATPTPFQPAAPTSMATPLPTAVVESTLNPTEEEPPAPPPVNENIVNIMVMGSDQRQSADYRTDVMMLVSLNPDTGTVSMVSFPRDLFVTIPNWGQDRINTAMEYGGFPMLADTMEYNFGVRPTHYILTNFQGFVAIVDSLGGIDINAAYALTDTCKFNWAYNGYCTVGPGPAHLDGQTALWYVRSRYSTSDFDRTRRAQEVLIGLFRSLVSLNALSRIPELYQLYQYNVLTDMGLTDMIPLASMAPGLFSNPERIRQYAVGPEYCYSYIVPETGASVLIPNYDAINVLIQQAVYGR